MTNLHTDCTDERLDQLADDMQGNVTTICKLHVTAKALLQNVNQHQDNFKVLVQEIRLFSTYYAKY